MDIDGFEVPRLAEFVHHELAFILRRLPRYEQLKFWKEIKPEADLKSSAAYQHYLIEPLG